MPRLIIYKTARGFTLIEVLIALVILATIATMAVVGLQAVIISDKRQMEVTDQLAAMQFAYLLLQRDIAQAINRPIVDSQNEWRPGWLGTSGAGSRLMTDIPVEGEILVEFSRAGLPNPLELADRSTLQRIAYVFDGKKLRRYEWSLLDRIAATPLSYRTLLEDISEVELVYFDEFGEKHKQWATEVAPSPAWLSNYPALTEMPAAMEWRFIHPRYGEIIWLFRINELLC